jgi:hypothetical protein
VPAKQHLVCWEEARQTFPLKPKAEITEDFLLYGGTHCWLGWSDLQAGNLAPKICSCALFSVRKQKAYKIFYILPSLETLVHAGSVRHSHGFFKR